MSFIGAIGAIATLVFIIKCGKRAVDGIEDKKCWTYLLVSMLAMSIGTSWPDMYMGIGMFFLLAWLAYLTNWLYKVIAHKTAKREKAAKKDFWMPIACFVLMIIVAAVSPKKEVDASSLAAESAAQSEPISSSAEQKVESEPTASSVNESPQVQSEPESQSEFAIQSEPVETEEEYKASCETVNYKDLCRYPDKYAGTRITIKVKVQQIMDVALFSNDKAWRAQENDSYGLYMGNEYYAVDKREPGSVKILQDDIVVIYGEFTGTTEITRALTGTKDEIPEINVQYADLVEE